MYFESCPPISKIVSTSGSISTAPRAWAVISSRIRSTFKKSPTTFLPDPVVAVPMALKHAGISLDLIDLIELNEAFASQSLYVVRTLGIDLDRLNVNGGSIALGHPLGCTGVYLTTKLLHEMKQRRSRYGLVTMCVGGGMGAAGVFEREE